MGELHLNEQDTQDRQKRTRPPIVTTRTSEYSVGKKEYKIFLVPEGLIFMQ